MIHRRIVFISVHAALLFAFVCVGYVIARTSKIDVVSRLASGANDKFCVTLEGANLSFSHGLSVRYIVTGHGEINGAHWRLWPFREVVTTK